MNCSKCGGNIIDIKPCNLELEPYYNDDRDYQEGFYGKCEDCGYEEVWANI